jgi:NADPH:quinone reductase-like Zn-dependent oxidoreductase
VQIAKARGAHVTALASGDGADLVRRLGAHEIVDHTVEGHLAAVQDMDVVLDVFGDARLGAVVSCTRPGGIIVTTLPQGLAAAAPAADAAAVRLTGLFVEADRLGLQELVALVEQDALRPEVAATYPLADAGAAQSEPHGPGKVVLVV